MSDEDKLRQKFPGLQAGGFSITSQCDISYNCLCWAAGRTDLWWEPDPLKIFYWPASVPRQYTLASYRKAYEAVGYKRCPGGDHEAGWEKIAIFVKDGEPTHAARQLPDGSWTSKLGEGHDISHPLDAVAGDEYGTPRLFMRRRSS